MNGLLEDYFRAPDDISRRMTEKQHANLAVMSQIITVASTLLFFTAL